MEALSPKELTCNSPLAHMRQGKFWLPKCLLDCFYSSNAGFTSFPGLAPEYHIYALWVRWWWNQQPLIHADIESNQLCAILYDDASKGLPPLLLALYLLENRPLTDGKVNEKAACEFALWVIASARNNVFLPCALPALRAWACAFLIKNHAFSQEFLPDLGHALIDIAHGSLPGHIFDGNVWEELSKFRHEDGNQPLAVRALLAATCKNIRQPEDNGIALLKLLEATGGPILEVIPEDWLEYLSRPAYSPSLRIEIPEIFLKINEPSGSGKGLGVCDGCLTSVDAFFNAIKAKRLEWLAPKWFMRRHPHFHDQVDSTEYKKISSKKKDVEGVNLIGWAGGKENGISEDLRCACLGLAAAGVPFEVHNADTSLNPDKLHYSTNIVFLAAHDLHRFRSAANAKIWEGKRTIASCPWEMMSFPPEMDYVFDVADEFWAPSEFIRKAFLPGGRPVVRMPLIVDVAAVQGSLRGELDIPEKVFLFVFVFNANSWHRKNPEAIVQAFLKAFPESSFPARLVMKSVNASNQPEKFKRLREMGNDPRIMHIDEYWEREKTLKLINSADCFVSLHRAEGFGRGLAESLALCKPVIASAWSGNLDFTNEANSWLVNGELMDNTETYIGGVTKGKWFEPDMECAAQAMRMAAQNPGLARQKGINGKELIRSRFSAEFVGARYLAYLLGHVQDNGTDWEVQEPH